MEYKITVHKGDTTRVITANRGDNLLEVLKDNNFHMLSPCGGKGSCGKCRVELEGQEEELTEKEKRLLASVKENSNTRLACYVSIKNDLVVYLEDNEMEAAILTEGISNAITLDPLLKKVYGKLDPPHIHDQRSDSDRIEEAFEGKLNGSDLALMAKIPQLLRDDYSLTAIMDGENIIGLEKGDTTGRFYGIAADIGTTTVAFYLYDLNTGEKLDVHSAINPQTKHGADVLSRIEYTDGSQKRQGEMHKLIIDCINGAIEVFSQNNNISQDDIYMSVFAGNTTMAHFLMGIPAKNLAVSPFIPVTTAKHKFFARDLAININQRGMGLILPGVSAYIGSDTVASVLSSKMYGTKEYCLLIDIGTNGEIVLSGDDWMYSCSTAAGPAFEGSNIQWGVGGINGAIDKIFFNDDVFYTTIGNYKAIGICGSGIVDAIGGMLKKEIIDETGRISDPEEIGAGAFARRIIDVNGANGFLLGDEDDGIFITQKDVRELQNAKAAIAAGIKILIKKAGIKPEEIKNIYLAGGFGNYINRDNAFAIGLIPKELNRERVVSVGNAAGAGAVMGLLSGDALAEADLIKERIHYIELSSSKEFVDEYVDAMFFY